MGKKINANNNLKGKLFIFKSGEILYLHFMDTKIILILSM